VGEADDERAMAATDETRRTAKDARKRAVVIFAGMTRRRHLNVREEKGMLRLRADPRICGEYLDFADQGRSNLTPVR